MNGRVFDGEIKEGFRRYRLVESEDSVRVVKSKRRHEFGRGYQEVGPRMDLTHDLGRDEAEAVRDLLDWWLTEGEDGGSR